MMDVFEIEPGRHPGFHDHPWEHQTFVVSGEAERQFAARLDVLGMPSGNRHDVRACDLGILRHG
jgi:quercetin dioxygenase-like cupin family protein